MVERRFQRNSAPSKQEHRVIELVAQGLTNRQIAKVIDATEFAVKNRLKTIYNKLGFWNRVELAIWYEARRHDRAKMN
jgi:two-component system, NarL family, response regulator DevR